MYLLTTIRSGINPKVTYGIQGDEVQCISEHGNVWIIEGPDKKRFPVNADKLTTELIKAAPGTAAKEKADASVASIEDQPFINQRAPVSKKVAPVKQQSLF